MNDRDVGQFDDPRMGLEGRVETLELLLLSALQTLRVARRVFTPHEKEQAGGSDLDRLIQEIEEELE